jgi:hypothetical protein
MCVAVYPLLMSLGCDVYTGRKISASLSYVTVRGEGKMERSRGSKTSYALSLPLLPRTSAGWPTMCVFVTVSEARRYLATSIIKVRCQVFELFRIPLLAV